MANVGPRPAEGSDDVVLSSRLLGRLSQNSGYQGRLPPRSGLHKSAPLLQLRVLIRNMGVLGPHCGVLVWCGTHTADTLPQRQG